VKCDGLRIVLIASTSPGRIPMRYPRTGPLLPGSRRCSPAYVRTSIPAAAIAAFACPIVNSPKWKMDAARTALYAAAAEVEA